MRAYGQVRHALQYLRREKNDAERYAPSLYGCRRSRKPKALTVNATQNADAQAAAVEQGASTQSAAIAPSANAPLPVETVPERQQELSPARSTSSDETLSPIEVESKKTLPKSPPLVPLQWPTRGNAAALTHGALPVSKIGSSASSTPYR